MGILYIVSTPIGNLQDITIRAIKTLFSVDYIACEDTRRTGNLLQELKSRFSYVIPAEAGIQNANKMDPRFHGDDKIIKNDLQLHLLRYDDHSEHTQTPLLIEKLTEGKNIALASDAGTPLINDPGYLLVRECRKRNIPVVSIPGPTALISALTVSGLPTDKFMFLGYPPEKRTHRIVLLKSLSEIFIRPPLASQGETLCKTSGITYIFYCAPHKLVQTLKDMKEIFGDIEIVIARELTKIHEEVWRGKLFEALNHFNFPKGEFVLLLPDVHS